MHNNSLVGTMPNIICKSSIDFSADCYNDSPINCSCCANRFSECY